MKQRLESVEDEAIEKTVECKSARTVSGAQLELCVEAADDLVNGVWSATTNQVMIDIPVDDSDVKFYRINYN